MIEISIIIRTKNEERWIGHCLSMVYEQSYQNFEIIIVDNNSTDHTLKIAKRFPISKIINIDNFYPGLALNLGIKNAKGQYIVCLSAHCIPKDNLWLENLRKSLLEEKNIAGVYGRQLPLTFTDPIDKRDLLYVFGIEKRIQKKDYFFHNANSIFKKRLWEKFPFDPNISNIEDRIWGKKVIQAGYYLAYCPDSAVYHHHGLHQGNDKIRATGVLSILNKIDSADLNQIPKTMLPKNINTIAILPIGKEFDNKIRSLKLLDKLIKDLQKSSFVKDVYLVCNKEIKKKFNNINFIDRKKIHESDLLGVNEILRETLVKIEKKNICPDMVLYVNYQYLKRPTNIFDKLISDFSHKGFDSVFPVSIDYGHFWYEGEDGEFIQTDVSMKNIKERKPVYRALYGLGSVTSAHLIRKGKITGGKIGFFLVNNKKYSPKLFDDLQLNLDNTK